VTPHVTQNNAVTKTGKIRNSAIDERTTRHPGYGMSQSRRSMTEWIFGWGKQHGTPKRTSADSSEFMSSLRGQSAQHFARRKVYNWNQK